jgi:hypothetical protein
MLMKKWPIRQGKKKMRRPAGDALRNDDIDVRSKIYSLRRCSVLGYLLGSDFRTVTLCFWILYTDRFMLEISVFFLN